MQQKEILELQELLERRFLTKIVDFNCVKFTYLSGVVDFDCSMKIDLESKSIVFEAILSLPFEEEFQMSALELCNCINEELFIGHFAISPKSGFLKFVNGMYFYKEELTQRKMRTLLESSILTIDRYIKSILYVFNGKAEGEDFSKVIELFGEDIGIGVSKSCHYKFEKHPSIERY